MLSENKD